MVAEGITQRFRKGDLPLVHVGARPVLFGDGVERMTFQWWDDAVRYAIVHAVEYRPYKPFVYAAINDRGERCWAIGIAEGHRHRWPRERRA